MHCVECEKSFVKKSLQNEKNSYGLEYKVKSNGLYNYLKKEENSTNIKPYIDNNCVCMNCINLKYKNNTVQYFDIHHACYLCWNNKKITKRSDTIFCENCQNHIKRLNEEGLLQLIQIGLSSRISKLFKNCDELEWIFHNDNFKISSEINLDFCAINVKLLNCIVIELDSNYHSTYSYEKEKERTLETQKYFQNKNMDCLYIRFGWIIGINTEELQKNMIILFDWIMLKLLYPKLYGFMIIGYPLTSKRISDYERDWNLLCYPFLCNNKRPYLDWDISNKKLNKFNKKNKIFDRLHIIYDCKKIMELFIHENDRFLITGTFLEYFLNDDILNLEHIYSIQNKYFMHNNIEIIKINKVEPCNLVGIYTKKFKLELELLNVITEEILEKEMIYNYSEIRILIKKIDNFIQDLDNNNIIIDSKNSSEKYVIKEFSDDNKIILNNIVNYEVDITQIFRNKLFKSISQTETQNESLTLILNDIVSNKKRKINHNHGNKEVTDEDNANKKNKKTYFDYSNFIYKEQKINLKNKIFILDDTEYKIGTLVYELIKKKKLDRENIPYNDLIFSTVNKILSKEFENIKIIDK